MASSPVQLTTSQQDTLDDIVNELKEFDWEKGEYLFHDFTEYFQFPQVIRVSQPWDTNLIKNDTLYLQTTCDRHLILSKSLSTDTRTYILPDWFQGQCRILSSNPTYRPRWWEFTGAVELLRFQMPREHIRLLRDMSVSLLLPTNQTIPVVLKENTEVTLKRIENSMTITKGKEMFVFTDKNDQEFLLDPTDATNSFRFATKILDDEFDKSYHKDTLENLFTLPEILIRYELPIDIELVSLTNTIPIESFPTQLRLEKYAIAKSVIAFSIADALHPKLLEFSSFSQFSLQCVKCLTTGLPRDTSVYEETQVFDENAYRHYETTREKLTQVFEEISIQYLRTPFVGTEEEVECIGKVFDIGIQIKNEKKTQTYVLLDQIDNSYNDVVPSISKHPARFTVHLPVDLNSPYSNIMEINEDDEDDHEMPPSTNT